MPKSKPPMKKRRGTKRQRRRQPLPDRRAMERYRTGLDRQVCEDALLAAQDVIYDAWEATTIKRRTELARRALTLSPLCADAYVILAEETARTLPAAVNIYRKGVDAGELALGEAAFEQCVGNFWGLLKTRPYMRARAGLAEVLWESDEREEAISHYRDMLRLNPNDNQGIRYLLAACYQTMERNDDLEHLLDDYDGDISAIWPYTRALAAFRRMGDAERSRGLLAAAIESNSHVPAFLLGWRALPLFRSEYITFGSEDEALEYWLEFGDGWEQTPGALTWLREGSPLTS